MTSSKESTAAVPRERCGSPCQLPQLARRFEALVFDWDGTAVPDRAASAADLRRLVESLCAVGMYVAIVTGTHLQNIDAQLSARPAGPGVLVLSVNRGSEVFVVDRSGPRLVERREGSAAEDHMLDLAASGTVGQLAARGIRATCVGSRLNRRKVDLIPLAAWKDPPKAAMAQLLSAVEARLRSAGLDGLREAVRLAEDASHRAGLADARITSDAKHVEIGLTDKRDAARWIFADLWRRGIGPSQVLIAGDELGSLGGVPGSDSLMRVPEALGATTVSVGVEPEGVPAGVIAVGGGPRELDRILTDQLDRRRRGELPEPAAELGWSIAVDGYHPEHERAHESLLAIADGAIGTRGGPLVARSMAAPQVYAQGLYDGEGSETTLLGCPRWAELAIGASALDDLRRLLDLRTGLFYQRVSVDGREVDSVALSSLAHPGSVALRARLPSDVELSSDAALVSPGGDRLHDSGRSGEWEWTRVAARPRGGVTVVTRQVLGPPFAGWRCLDRVGRYSVSGDGTPTPAAAIAAARSTGSFEAMLTEQREEWAARWEDADVVVTGDEEVQRGLRLALFHLMAAVGDAGESAVGARGLTGPAYRGHVFWDSDVFVLPFLAATRPAAARAMLEYRVRRLGEAERAARCEGLAGARFPWESARTGEDVTPRAVRDRSGRDIAIRTGQQEAHIVADVAWAAACYVDWTGDAEIARGSAARLLIETARYWAARVRRSADGRGHIDRVMGPDEYHESVDDNAFTNVMARWNLERAAAHVATYPCGVDDAERVRWLETAASIVDGFDTASGLYEQFRGFFELEPLIVEHAVPRRPIAADLLLGRERVAGAQVIKQADVLLLYHLVPDAMRESTLRGNVAYYEPRTAHGSSLSPAVHVPLFARIDDWERAMRWLRVACRLDLSDLTGTTAGGVHLATMGGLWQAVAMGFVGLRPRPAGLSLHPRLPPGWRGLEVRVRYRGRRVRVRIEPWRAVVMADGPVPVVVPDGSVVEVGPSGIELQQRDERWTVSVP